MGTSGNRKMVFKRFTVFDEKCAMKIGTDGVTLGAWASPYSPTTSYAATTPLKIADIGSGSGVISLMLAQRFPDSSISAIELEPQAAEQSRENFVSSPFSSQLTCEEISFQDWTDLKLNLSIFDLVVSNPPFFHGKPKSPFHARNLARHDDYLTIDELFNGARKVLKEGGVFTLVWPSEREDDLMKSSTAHDFVQTKRCEIRPRPDRPAVRFLAEFVKITTPETKLERLESSILTLETGEGEGRNFTDEYSQLMSDFFLDK
ncbi:MAG TPA: methyltransferase domain-containing protein [Flavobacteriales bacterium]|nr:methyltransferase domain-containing protein [Flavobacteriales bacterium]HIB77083.1 methyltransferase domain-containing protein [Flavobacteriales bacterium]HIN41011.1 methyltransferase domain-containing protein [Flavobacteriales bacterium]HIO15267.1 methyltransferase domain-containing protein [Flavobacteriales bacterium]